VQMESPNSEAEQRQRGSRTSVKGEKSLVVASFYRAKRERGSGRVPRVGDIYRRRDRIGDKRHVGFTCPRVSDRWAAVKILNVARVRFVTGSHCFELNPLTNGFLYFPNELNCKLKNPLMLLQNLPKFAC
jgi:hypothetical protein